MAESISHLSDHEHGDGYRQNDLDEEVIQIIILNNYRILFRKCALTKLDKLFRLLLVSWLDKQATPESYKIKLNTQKHLLVHCIND